jgi:hypothetical protein
MSILETFDVSTWSGPIAHDVQDRAVDALEAGHVIFLPRLRFEFAADEQSLLSPKVSDGKAKNISLDPLTNSLKGTVAEGEERQRLQKMMERFAQSATHLVSDLLPNYAPVLERARTSYRPVEIVGRHYSPLKDDRLLHVDAFPSQPMRGRRILRLFSNIDPTGQPRLWHVGGPFDELSRRLAPSVPRPNPAVAWLLSAVGITKGRRSAYDQLMLSLHDVGKRDESYQATGIREKISFPAGSTWLCFTDQVSHAALAGKHALEQTFHVEIDAMAQPDRSPLRVLERLTGKALV